VLEALPDPSLLDQGNEVWHKYRAACASSLYFFTKAVWLTMPPELNLLTKRCHLPICLVLEDDSIKRILVEWPRRHLKTTLVGAGMVHKLVRRVVANQDPADRFGIYSSTITNSSRMWREIKNSFESNQLFQFLFPELIPDSFEGRDTVWTTMEGVVPRQWDRKDPTFDCLGAGKAVSRHYDWIIEDDLINEENYDSPDAVAKALDIHRNAEHLLEDATNSRVITVGNRWGMGDLNHFIHTEEPSTSIISVSVYGAHFEGKYKCRNLPKPVTELLEALPKGEPIWPERFDRDALGRLLEKLKPRIFTAQYLNNPSDPDMVDFRLEWLKYCTVEHIDGMPNVVYEDDPVPVPLSHCNLYVTWDPALDGKASESANGITVTAMDYKGRISLISDYAKKRDPLLSMDDFIDYCKRCGPYLQASGVEEVLFQRVLTKLLPPRAQAKGVNIRLRKLKTPTGMSKDQRIRAWIGSLFADGRVYVRHSCSHFIDQYAHFGVPDAPRDVIDAFSYATKLWQRPMSPAEQEAAEQSAVIIHQDLGVTGYGTALAV